MAFYHKYLSVVSFESEYKEAVFYCGAAQNVPLLSAYSVRDSTLISHKL